MVEWSKDQYVNPNSQTSLGKTLMLRIYTNFVKILWLNVMDKKIIFLVFFFFLLNTLAEYLALRHTDLVDSLKGEHLVRLHFAVLYCANCIVLITSVEIYLWFLIPIAYAEIVWLPPISS